MSNLNPIEMHFDESYHFDISRSIDRIAKTGTEGVVDTYTIYYTDGGTDTFTVTNGTKGDPGSPGADGKDGKDGSDGQDGVSPTISVSEITGGHQLTITDAAGTRTVDVMDGTDGQDGTDGADGYTPVKGTDYWTAADKAEIVADVVAEFGNAETEAY